MINYLNPTLFLGVMVIYDEDLQWHKLLDKGLEVALLAHADPGQGHGESVGLSRAFELAKKFGAIPVDHILSYELMVRYPKQFQSMMEIAGSNHTWLSTTLCIYTGHGKKGDPTSPNLSNTLPEFEHEPLLKFGYVEETGAGMNYLVVPSDIPDHFRVIDKILDELEDSLKDEIPPYLYVRIPEELENQFMVVRYPDYKLKKRRNLGQNGSLVDVDWEKVRIIPNEQVQIATSKNYPDFNHINNSTLLPDFLNSFQETRTHFTNPTLGFFAPAESYGPMGSGKVYTNPWNFWRISTRGEAVIIQRPI